MIPKMSTMQTPNTREEFEIRVNLTLEQMRLGLVHAADGVRGQDSLANIRHLPNGRVDLLSIDEMARVQLNMAYQMQSVDFSDLIKGGDVD